MLYCTGRPANASGKCSMPFDFGVKCPHPGCEFHQTPIRLLVASLGAVPEGPVGWPDERTQLYLACPACRRVTVHCQADVYDFPENAPGVGYRGKVWIHVALLCGAEGCSTPADIHVLMNQASNNQLASELQTKLATTHWTGVLPCGHHIASVGKGRWYFDRPLKGQLWEHKPFDPRLAVPRKYGKY